MHNFREIDDLQIKILDSFAICIPFIHNVEIESFEELISLVIIRMPEFIKREHSRTLLKNSFDHFRLLEVLPVMVTIEQVEHAARDLGINRDNAVKWIFDRLPIIYSLIESKLPETKAYPTVSKIRTLLDEISQEKEE